MNPSFIKYSLFFFSLMTIALTKAQTIEEEVAKKSCECIQMKVSTYGQISKAETQKCVSKSGDEVLKSKHPQEVKRLTKSMEGVVERLKIIYKMVEKCLPKTDSN